MPDPDKYVSYKQAFSGMLALAGILITLSLSIWAHEKSQDQKIEENASGVQAAIQKASGLKEDISEIKTLLKTQIDLDTDTRERVIRIEEKVKDWKTTYYI